MNAFIASIVNKLNRKLTMNESIEYGYEKYTMVLFALRGCSDTNKKLKAQFRMKRKRVELT